MLKPTVKLYYANWCGHCRNFADKWSALKNFFDQNDVAHEEFEDGSNKEEIKNAKISAYPTLRIERGNEIEEYRGPMDVQSIIQRVLPNYQLGGAAASYKKYRKYKAKYLKLKGI